jgi:DNA-binding NarL/FixJ family response regulator
MHNPRVNSVAWPTTEVVARHEVAARQQSLTPRLIEVAQLMAAGLDNKAIAARLSLAPGTISQYMRQIYMRLRLSKRSQIAQWLASEATEPGDVSGGTYAPVSSSSVT